LKYTSDGFIYIKLASSELPRDSSGSKRSRITLIIKDTGRGMSKEYLQNHLFRPFAQEDPLNPGAGLGLSMVRHIVSNLGGEISVESELNKGTEIRVEVIMMDPVSSPETNDEAFIMTEAAQKLHGLQAVFVDPPNTSDGETPSQRSLRNALDKQCWGWFKMEFSTVSKVDEVGNAAVVLTTCHTLPNIKEQLVRLGKPIIVLCESNTQLRQVYVGNEALRKAVTAEFIAQPYGPRKLARAFVICKEQHPPQLEDVILYRDTEIMTLPTMPVSDAKKHAHERNNKRPSDSHEQTRPRAVQDESKAAEGTKGPAEQETGPKPLRLLLVDDNKINLQLLVRYCKSKKHDYATAEDGVQAVEAFCSHQQDAAKKFDFVCMDISMPRMDGLEATRRIRSFEQSNGLQASKVIALTGLASAEAQQEAFSSGVDQFMTKPVRLKELGEVLAGRR
jgi:CheY-like chemotaxis protein